MAVASVLRLLPLDTGDVAVALRGNGVAQTKGVTSGPKMIGPPCEKLVVASLAALAPWALADSTLAPSMRITPRPNDL